MAHAADPLVRKTVTVLFCDVTGSTSLGERMDPETLRRVMLEYFDEMRAAIERHGGTVEKFIGDAVMAVFGVPVVHEDDALRAVRAADEMRRALTRLNNELDERFGVRLEMRIGINTGEVVVGDPTAKHLIATGDAVNVAARLQQAAQPGEILLGRETHRLVADRIRAGPLETFTLKGKSEPVRSWRLDEVRAGAELIFRRLDSPLVGREHERDFLRNAYRAVIEDQSCRLVTVLGAAGVGKTRLAQEVAARSFGATVAQGRCLSYGDGITFFPVAEVVRSLAGVAADDDQSVVEARIAQLLPPGEEAALVTERLVALLATDGAARAEEVFWAVRKLLEVVARSRPLVLVLEDLHWAEPTLLDLVEYLVGWSRGAPMLVLALARPELLELRPGWPGDRLTLEPLGTDEVRTLLGNLLGAAELDAGVARRIEDAADGNPLFVEELVRMLVDDGTLVLDKGQWVASDVGELPIPPSINALLSARLDRLDLEEQAVLQCASVIGKQFWWSAVAELVPEESREHVGPHLHGLVRKRLVFPAESTSFASEDSFRFGHILVCDAAYAGLSKARRAELHERFADWLGRKGGPEEIRGHHLERAHAALQELGQVNGETHALGERAATLLASAGRRAALRADTPAAGALLGRAAALLPAGEPRAEILLDLGITQIRSGELTTARHSLEEAIGSGAERIRLRAQIELAFLEMLLDPKCATLRMREVAEEAIPALQALDDEAGQARAWWLLSEADVVACQWSARASALERAISHARRADETGQEGTLIRHLAHALVYGPAPAPEGIERCEGFLAEAGNDRVLRASVLGSLAVLRAMRREFDAARALYGEARMLYDELTLSSLRAMRSLVPAEIEMLAGDPAAAERELRWGYDVLTSMGERGIRSTLAAFLADTLCAQGRFAEADQLAKVSEETAADDDLVTQAVWRRARAKVLADGGEYDEAERIAETARALAGPTDFLDLKASTAAALAHVLLAAGNRASAEPLLGEARELYERKGNLAAAAAVEQVLAPDFA
jgi:class 3 adenylate cyclase/tetratricopeptide (TPR) repeat protein